MVSPGALLAILAAGAAYGRAVTRHPRGWSPSRSWAFGAGLAVLAAATQGPVSANDGDFAVHAVQHLLLAMVAPPLLALGAPVTLVLQTSSPRTRRRVAAVLRHPAVRTATHPLVAFTVFGATPFALYFTGLYDATLTNLAVHEAVHVVFLVGGTLFFWPVVGLDPAPHRLPHVARLGLLFLAVPFHAFLGIALLWGGDADRHIGGGIIWASGDVLALVMLGAVLGQWMAADGREARREDRRLDGARMPA